ncbi:hypothetical protein [Geobacter sp.]|uniref:hypothetical protein n=1 Tax=Geobacter sp. TaxID=46610 RepID=UPI0026292DAE|nr:hypothetical protein [Geobacter sp.]
MNILLVGFPVFARELAALGHAVYSAGTVPGYDVVLPPEEFSLDSILAALGPSRRPDLCLLVENIGAREFPLGLEGSPIPFVFYSIDSHLNFLLAAGSYLDAWRGGEGRNDLLEKAAHALAMTYKLPEAAEVMRLVCEQTNAPEHHDDFLRGIEDAMGGRPKEGGIAEDSQSF